MQFPKQIKHNFPIREIPKQRFRLNSYLPKVLSVSSSSSSSWSNLYGDSASCGGSSNDRNSSSSTSSNSLSGGTLQRQTKNSEHESGYYDDLSDLEDRGNTAIGTKPVRFASVEPMRYYTLTADVSKLEMNDSPASPNSEDDGEEEVAQEGEEGCEAVISSEMLTPTSCKTHSEGESSSDQELIKRLAHYKKSYLHPDNPERISEDAPAYLRLSYSEKIVRWSASHIKVNLLRKIDEESDDE